MKSCCDCSSSHSQVSQILVLILKGSEMDSLICLTILIVLGRSHIIPAHQPHFITLGDGQPILSSIPVKRCPYLRSISIAVWMRLSPFPP